ncbi:MAG: 30S ribosomal protein S13 [Patescibacteria group bacterium]
MRIAGITIPEKKPLQIGLTAIYGIGRSKASELMSEAKIPLGLRPKDVSPELENKLRGIIEKMKVEGELRRIISGNIKRLKDIKSYRGSRHAKRLPVRGGRTKTNSRTVRGNTRRTMGSGRRTVEKT